MDNTRVNMVTDRLVLKAVDRSYAKRVLDFFLRNHEFLERWEPEREEDFYTEEYQVDQLDRDMIEMRDGRMFRVWIFKKGDEGAERIIGSTALNNIVMGCFRSCFLGYRMDKDEINKGYMTEALNAVIYHAFNQLMLHRIEANIMPSNKPSRRVVEKLGFYNEGLAKKYLKINGKWEDHIHMVLLNENLSS